MEVKIGAIERDNVINFDLAKKLKEFGLEQDSYTWWRECCREGCLFNRGMIGMLEKQDSPEKFFSAFSAQELLKYMPPKFTIERINNSELGEIVNISFYYDNVNYVKNKELSLVNCMAEVIMVSLYKDKWKLRLKEERSSRVSELYYLEHPKELLDLIEVDEDIYDASENEDGTIDFTLRFYNGSCDFEEALGDALRKIK